MTIAGWSAGGGRSGEGLYYETSGLLVTFILLGKYLEAIPHFREALRLKPDFSEARANLDKAHEALKK